jgi:protein phosphatase
MSNIVSFFGTSVLYEEAIATFAYIPLAARIDGQILCLHGGIGPNVTDVNTIANITRPIDSFGDDIVDSVVWSDPNEMIDGFRESPTRGAGYLFGKVVLDSFLNDSGLFMLVRGHECVPEGTKSLFNERLITVFSASNYCGLMGNLAAVLEVTGPRMYHVHTFGPLPWLLRNDVKFGRDPSGKDSPRQCHAGIKGSVTTAALLAGTHESPHAGPLVKAQWSFGRKTESARPRPPLLPSGT